MRLPCALVLALLVLPRAASAQATPEALADALEQAWRARSVDGYLGLWTFPAEAARADERATAAAVLEAELAEIAVQRPSLPVEGSPHRHLVAQLMEVREPRGRVRQWRFRLAEEGGRWRIVEREDVGEVDGLVHLAFDPTPYDAAGLTVRLEDLEITFQEGTVFLSTPDLGPTALTFVGRGRVRFHPAPAAERDQLRQYVGAPALEDEVKAAFLRIHPADLHRVLSPVRLEPRPAHAARAASAERFYRAQGERMYLLDAPLPRSPWWVLPTLGDAAVVFQTARHGTLTYTFTAADPEGVALFDRARRRQICLYPPRGRDTAYDEDLTRPIDVVSHDLRVRFDPVVAGVRGEDAVRLRLRAPVSSVRLRMDDSLTVHSVRSALGGEHLFFRVRDQDSLMVSLGPLTGQEEIVLHVVWAGTHRPDVVEREVVQVVDPAAARSMPGEEILIEEVHVYTNRTAWYPHGGADDYATARVRFDVPADTMAVTGGARTAVRVENGRRLLEYRQDEPGKYITVAVGRIVEAGTRTDGSPALHAHAVPRLRPRAPALLAQARQILDFFTAQFGPCPYPRLNLVALEGRAPGGHSPPGMVVLVERPLLLRSTLVDDPASFHDIPGFFLAHELAHQWWGHGVAGQNYRERWLSEALAQYAAALWTRHTHGEVVFARVLERMARWGLKATGEGPIHLGHRLGHLKDDPQVFRAVVYDKGAYVLHMLRQVVGEEPFAAALRALQAERRFGKAGTADLRGALEKASGLALGPYFEAWVMGTALPEVRYRYSTAPEGPRYRTTVQVEASHLPGPVPLEIAVVHRGGRTTERVTLVPEGGRYRIDTDKPVRRVEVNAGRGLLATVKPVG